METMDIQSKISKKQIWAGAGISVVFFLVFFGVLNFAISPSDPSNAIIKTTQNFITNKINSDFLNPFKETPTPQPKIKIVKVPTKIIVKRKPVISLKPTKFDEIFNDFKYEKQNTNTVQRFLMNANKSSQVRTFVVNTNKTDTPKKDKTKITIGYKKLGISRVDASYPIDFSRVLTADKNIDAILINNIDSSLGGKVIAQIENNVYATQGRNIVIPIGSKVIGYYQQLDKVGDSRLKIVWNRIITPKGVNIVMNAEMADAMGRSGIAGTIDSKFWDKYGLALLVSTVSALAQASANVSVEKNQAIFINSYGKELSNLSAKILEEQINIRPTIRIAAGRRILISPTQDIWFRNNQGVVEIKPNLASIQTQ